MSNQNRANDHLFNKLFIAYEDIYYSGRPSYSRDLSMIVDNSKSELMIILKEYCESINDNSDNSKKLLNQRKIGYKVPSGSSVKVYADDLYDYKGLTKSAENKCRLLLRAIFFRIYHDANNNPNTVKDIIAKNLIESRELSALDQVDLRRGIEDINNIYTLIDIALISSFFEIEKASNKFHAKILKDIEAEKYISIQFVLCVSEMDTVTSMQDAITAFNRNMNAIFNDKLFLLSDILYSAVNEDPCFQFSSRSKYIFVLDYRVPSEVEMLYKLAKQTREDICFSPEIWVMNNDSKHGSQNEICIRLIKDAREQGYRITSYKDISDILLDAFSYYIKNRNSSDEHDIQITNKILYVDGKEMLSLEKSAPYNSRQVELLNYKVSSLKKQYKTSLKECEELKNKIDDCNYQLQALSNNMDEILTTLVCNYTEHSKALNKYYNVNFWGSNPEKAYKDLLSSKWSGTLDKGAKEIENGLRRIEEYMDSRMLLIQIVQSQTNDENYETNKKTIIGIYNEIEELVRKYHIRNDLLYKYNEFLYRISDYEMCIEKSEKLLKILDCEDNQKELMCQVCILLGNTYRALGKYDLAISYLNLVQPDTLDRGSKLYLQYAVVKMAVLFLLNDMKSFGPVLDSIPDEVIESDTDEPDMRFIQTRIYHDRGLFYHHNSEYKKAIDSYERAISKYQLLIEKYKQASDSAKLAEVIDRYTSSLNNLSDLYMLDENYDLKRAEAGYLEAMELAEKYSHPLLYPDIFVSKKAIYNLKLANVLFKKEKYDEALKRYDEAIQIRLKLIEENPKFRRGLMFAYVKRAELNMHFNKMKLAKTDLDEVEAILNDVQTVDSSALIVVKCRYYSALAIWNAMKYGKRSKKQFNNAVKFWDEYSITDELYANRKKNEFIQKYQQIIDSKAE